jgi:cytochrome c553
MLGGIQTLAVFAIIAVLSAGCGKQTGNERLPPAISYNFHVRPILADKCFACHGPDANKREAGLRLDIPDSAYRHLKDNPAAFALVPEKPEESHVFLRISSPDTTERMPPPSSNLTLSARDIKIIEKWIRQGARYEPHWAFVAPEKPAIPEVEAENWPQNEIDYFILRSIEDHGLEAGGKADKELLLKRASLDITGLPPSLEMMDRFLAHDSPDAWEQVIDQLLASPAYGERMAIYWCDVARYADSYGYQDDNLRTQWPWRDWVIHAFNTNMPYDRFVTWQIAGDMLPDATREQVLATAFNRNHKFTEEGGVIDEEYRIEYVTDKTNTLGKGLLALTVECAKCHDHKYDPISQKDYYSLFAFFNNTYEKGYEGDITQSKTAKPPMMKLSDQEVREVLTFISKKDTSSLLVSVMGERDSLRKTYVLNRGNYDAPTVEVTPATPESILQFDETLPRNRLGLAKWLVDKRNPLTARVFVNRMWQEFFGKGIVETSGDFGMQGKLPSHPELLDWMAVDFMEHGWDIKRLIKQLLTSATYMQSATVTPEKLAKDPDNVYLSRAPRYRLSAELVRDLLLASSGLLVRDIGGPSVKPYQPDGMWEASTSGRGLLATYRQDHGEDLYRRGLYTFIKLTVPPPSMIIFDGSNRDQCEVRRLRTNTPLQALVMMNDPHVLEASRVLAARLLSETSTEQEKIEKAFRLIVCRRPTSEELSILAGYFDEEKKQFSKTPQKAEALLKVGEYPPDSMPDQASHAALMQVICSIYNLEEAITKS